MFFSLLAYIRGQKTSSSKIDTKMPTKVPTDDVPTPVLPIATAVQGVEFQKRGALRFHMLIPAKQFKR